jgi:hypothetical protein
MHKIFSGDKHLDAGELKRSQMSVIDVLLHGYLIHSPVQ